jgi:MFS family permease
MKFVFEPKAGLTDAEVNAGLRSVVKDGIASQSMLTLTAGVFLIAFALKLGASNFMIGVLMAIPPLTQLVQIPAIYLIEKYRLRKTIAVYFAGLSRTFLLIIALIPFLFVSQTALILVIVALFVHTTLNAVLVCSWNSWMRDLIPIPLLGTFFSKRMSYSVVPAMILSLGAGLLLDFWEHHFQSNITHCYSLLFALGFAAGMIGSYFISTIPEPKMMQSEEKMRFRELIIQPFKDVNYKNLLIFLGSWNFAINLAGPFFAVYLIKRIGLGMVWVAGLTVIGQLAYFLFLKIWGILVDKFSNKSVLSVSGTLFIFSILGWTFTTMPEKHSLTMPLLILIHIFMGISTSGVALASGNIGLKLAPKGKATAYLAANSIINSLAAGFAPIVGGLFADFFTKREISWIFKWTNPDDVFTFQSLNFRGLDFFFFFAFIIGLYSIHRLATVRETGDVEEKIIINEFLELTTSRIRSLTTVAGLRYLIQVPNLLKRRKKVRSKDKMKKNIET